MNNTESLHRRVVEFTKPINQRYECLYGIQPNQRSMRVWHAAGVNLRVYFRFYAI